MAEFDDIEYEGIGADRSIGSVGSERCFRDRSPCDTVISLSDDGKGLYSYPIPLFHEPSEQQQQEQHEPPVFGRDSATLNYHALAAAVESRPSSSGSSTSPLGRYRRDMQAHEQLVVGETPHYQRKRSLVTDDEEAGCSSRSKSWRSTTPEGLPPAPHGKSVPRMSSPAAELSEMIELKDSPDWNDLSVEEQVRHVRKMGVLKQRVQAQDNRRKPSAVRVRKRSRLTTKKD
ncbi:hypothetical protein F5X99DRAFT_398856 [Biscogniauxia marginata]|nr:hypothetical protein F5X99DRAFT_398856 [Biscogniauxia marginata]